MQLENYSIINWITKHGIKTETGMPYSFDRHMFMYDVLRDMAGLKKPLVIYKAAQIGFSTGAIISSFWIARNKGVDMIYTLPTMSDVQDFAGGKINRIVAQNDVLKSWIKGHDTIEQKTVGNNIIYYRGTFTQKAAMMVSSDLNVYDEVDASDQRVVEQYSTRLQASDLRMEWYFSHPSVEGNGVSKYWPKSDQKHWFVKCDCGKWQYLDWPSSINMEKGIYQCSCGKEITDIQRRNGKWVAKYPNKEFSGYWIPLLICPWVSAKDIIKYHNDKTEEYFTNKVLGIPYVGSGNKVTLDVLARNFSNEINMQEGQIVIGVDTGLGIHLVVGNKEGLFYYDSSSGYEEFERLMKRYPKAVAVFDAQGDLQKPRELQEKYIGRIFLCYYREDRKTQQLIKWGTHDEEGVVQGDRNRLIQLLVDEFSGKRIPLQGGESTWYDYYLHWKAIYRQEKENALGVKVKRWERSGDDHLVHATVYWRIGMDRFSYDEGGIIKVDEVKYGVSPLIMPDQTMHIEGITKIQ